MNAEEILAKLKEPFPAEHHKDRKIKGGGRWWYLPHQAIRDRLNDVCGGAWQTKYTLSHREADGDPVYFCELTICGITRTGIGDKSNEDSTFGTPSERSFRKSFMDAAEQFGIGAYLDLQSSDKTKADFIKMMQRAGNGAPAVEYHRQQGSIPTKPSPAKSQAKPFGKPALAIAPSPTAPALATEAQLKRFWAIAKNTGYTQEGCKALIAAFGFASSKEITANAYEGLCVKAADAELAAVYSDRAKQSAEVAF